MKQSNFGIYERFITALAIVPIVGLAIFMIKLGVDVPYWDAWRIAADMADPDGLSLQSAWKLHNEHRIFFPKLVMLILGRISQWNIHYELAGVFLCILLICACVIYFIRRLPLTEINAIPAVIWPIVTIILCNLAGFENWLWGWQITFLIAHLAIIIFVAMLVLWLHTGSRLQFFTATLACIIASFSTGHGLACWPLGIVAISFAEKRRIPAMTIWLIVCALTLLLYFHEYAAPPHHKTADYLQQFVSAPVIYISSLLCYIGLYIGGSLSIFDAGIAMLAGVIGIIGFFVIAFQNLKTIKSSPALSFFLLLGLYSLFAATITGVLRMEFGAFQALAPRYVIVSSLFWVSIIILMLLNPKKRASHKPEWHILTSLIVVFLIFSSFHSMPVAKNYSYQLQDSRDYLLQNYPDKIDEKIIRSFIEPAFLQEGLKGLDAIAKSKMSIFRNR